ncbi:jg3309 [Pararge aegeria aegeria]|uniref:Jg3309 protein n=1 Tax=Pararge aegeria aegeria TaxID=348720 RepID=A0A8S4RTQ9_9NEOP|nr:jg3309 [Pararge aegeria aegeria]
MTSVDEFVNSSAWLVKVSGAKRGRERYAAPTADAHGGRIAARAPPPRPLTPPHPDDNMELVSVPRHRPLAFDKIHTKALEARGLITAQTTKIVRGGPEPTIPSFLHTLRSQSWQSLIGREENRLRRGITSRMPLSVQIIDASSLHNKHVQYVNGRYVNAR